MGSVQPQLPSAWMFGVWTRSGKADETHRGPAGRGRKKRVKNKY